MTNSDVWSQVQEFVKEATVLFFNESSDMQFFYLLVLFCFHIFKTDQMGFSRLLSIPFHS